MIIGEVNWIIGILAAIVSMAVGFVWYGKALFGATWMKEMGISKDKMSSMKQGMGKTYAINAVFAIVMAYVLAHVVRLGGADTFGTGLMAGFWMWLGFIVPILVGGILWEGKSQKLFMINAGYWLVSTGLMGSVLAMWS